MSQEYEELKVWRPFEGLALGEHCALCGKELAVFTPVFQILAGARAGKLLCWSCWRAWSNWRPRCPCCKQVLPEP